MLGYAAARAWRGLPLNREMLNRVADLMIQNKFDAGTIDISRKKFYMFVFESLKRLPARDQAVAKLMLVSIARLTSTHNERGRQWRLIEDQFIEDRGIRHATTEQQAHRSAGKTFMLEGSISNCWPRAEVCFPDSCYARGKVF